LHVGCASSVISVCFERGSPLLLFSVFVNVHPRTARTTRTIATPDFKTARRR